MRSKPRRAWTRWGAAVALLLTAMACYPTKFACKGYPDGKQCVRVSEVADDPGQLEAPDVGGGAGAAPTGRPSAAAGQAPIQLGRPLVTAPQVVRIWLAPWRDAKNRLHEAAYVYLMVEPADWVFPTPSIPGRHASASETGRVILPKAPAEKPDWSLTRGKEGASGQKRALRQVPKRGGQPGVPGPPGAPAPPSLPPMLPMPGGHVPPVIPMPPGVGAPMEPSGLAPTADPAWTDPAMMGTPPAGVYGP